MTFEELNRAIEFIVEQQARLSAALDRQQETSRVDYAWSKGMTKQLAVSNQRVVELIASNTQRLDQNDREHRKFVESQREFQRDLHELEKQSQTRHEEAMARLDRILDRLTRDQSNRN